MDANALSRFMDKVQKDPDTGCWEWTAATWQGYAVFSYQGKPQTGHRLMAEHVGMDIDGLQVRHICDNQCCVNPDHLEPGTQVDNSRDMRERGRSLIGSRNTQAQLTEADVIYMRVLYEYPTNKIGLGKMFSEKYGVSPQAICDLLKGRTWRHI